MSVFASYHPPMSWARIGLLAFVFVALGAAALVWRSIPGSLRTASQGDALIGQSPDESAVEAQATVFPEPRPVRWGGMVTRSLAGGRGAEVKSIEAPGGWFFAYDDDGLPASMSEGPVLVEGMWTGISCEYGRCAPEVEVRSVSPLPIGL